MNSKPVPYQRMVFICTNKREDGRPACGLRGSEEICERLKQEVKKRGLKGKVRALKSGCMDLCEIGPNVMIFPDNVFKYTSNMAKHLPGLAAGTQA